MGQRDDGPFDAKVDAAGNLYEALQGCVRKLDPGGVVTTVAGNGAVGHMDGTGGPSGTAEFLLGGIALDPAGISSWPTLAILASGRLRSMARS